MYSINHAEDWKVHVHLHGGFAFYNGDQLERLHSAGGLISQQES